MNRAMKVGALGAAIGFFLMICMLVFRVRSPLILDTLWPSHFLSNAAKGSLWMLTMGTLGFFANALLYGVIGYGIGRMMYGKDEPRKAPPK